MDSGSLIDAIGDSIVNPRCDDCGMSMSTPRPDQIGMPRQCGFCAQKASRLRQIERADWISQERPRGRRVHVVKLPDCMRSTPSPDPGAPQPSTPTVGD